MTAIDTIGLLELSSIAKGLEAADAMLKAADVQLLLSRTVCSGKYLIAVSGDVASVRAGVLSGAAAARGAVIEEGVISRLHPSIFPAIGQSVQLSAADRGALGAVETFSAASIIRAADAGIKAAPVTLFRVHLAMALGGKGYCLMTGDVASVQAAVEAASMAVEGMLAGRTVIPFPHAALFREFI
jgi:microcompartment protein CcmL/EutN